MKNFEVVFEVNALLHHGPHRGFSTETSSSTPDRRGLSLGGGLRAMPTRASLHPSNTMARSAAHNQISMLQGVTRISLEVQRVNRRFGHSLKLKCVSCVVTKGSGVTRQVKQPT